MAYLVLVEFILHMLQMLKKIKDKSGHVHAGFIVDFFLGGFNFWGRLTAAIPIEQK